MPFHLPTTSHACPIVRSSVAPASIFSTKLPLAEQYSMSIITVTVPFNRAFQCLYDSASKMGLTSHMDRATLRAIVGKLRADGANSTLLQSNVLFSSQELAPQPHLPLRDFATRVPTTTRTRCPGHACRQGGLWLAVAKTRVDSEWLPTSTSGGCKLLDLDAGD